jgi:1-acyl-sn-glycerol-3-phosphate acyltransferase
MASFKKFIGKTFFKLIGWKFEGELPKNPKYVCVLAPHTSIWDMILGKMYNWGTGMQTKIMVKKEFFFFPMGSLLRLWGAIPINRQYPGGIVKQMTDTFNEKSEFILTITPEGTRAPNPDWKSGFYRIAVEADVPIFIAIADFKSKRAGFLGQFIPTGNQEKDIQAIKEYYRGMEGLRKGKFVID